MDNDKPYLLVKSQRSQSASSPSPSLFDRDHRHRSSLPNALLIPHQRDAGAFSSSSQSSSKSSSSDIHSQLNRTSVISYSGSNVGSLHSKPNYCQPNQSDQARDQNFSTTLASRALLHKPVSVSSLSLHSMIESKNQLTSDRRHSLNAIISDLSCTTDYEMPESSETCYSEDSSKNEIEPRQEATSLIMDRPSCIITITFRLRQNVPQISPIIWTIRTVIGLNCRIDKMIHLLMKHLVH